MTPPSMSLPHGPSSPNSSNDEPKRKRIKKAPQGPRCQFFIERKNRQCPLQVPAGKNWCRQHDPDQSERVKCPLDPTHSVVKIHLADHLQRCNKRFKEKPWFKKDYHWLSYKEEAKTINGRSEAADGYEKESELDASNTRSGECEQETILQECDKESDDLCIATSTANAAQTQLIKYVVSVLDGITFEPLKKKHLHHKGLEPRLNQVTNQKHALQQLSLIGSLKEYDMLSENNYYVEFGCGKAEFSKYVADCITHDHQNTLMDKLGFGLIDRGVNRLKTDGKLKQITPLVKRDRIDIKDLDLEKFLEGEPATLVVAILKHLCGVATDLTFRCLHTIQSRVKGAVVAMCCRHVCKYHQLSPEARQFLARHHIKAESHFKALQKVALWAVDGGKDVEVVLKARRLIDEARVQGVRQQFAQHHVELIEYASRETTLENCAMCVYIKR